MKNSNWNKQTRMGWGYPWWWNSVIHMNQQWLHQIWKEVKGTVCGEGLRGRKPHLVRAFLSLLRISTKHFIRFFAKFQFTVSLFWYCTQDKRFNDNKANFNDKFNWMSPTDATKNNDTFNINSVSFVSIQRNWKDYIHTYSMCLV